MKAKLLVENVLFITQDITYICKFIFLNDENKI